MKKLLLISSIVVSISYPLFADTLAQWTFESLAPTVSYAPGAGVGTTNFLAEAGTQAGTAAATGFHTASATYSDPSGNGSTHALSVNTWTVGDYWQLQLSTSGHTGLSISFDQTGSGTGPKDFTLSYSLTGTGSFTTIGSYAVPLSTWNVTTVMPGFTETFDLGSFTDINDAPSVFFRISNTDTTAINNGTVGSGGTDRIDNVMVFDTPVPEPSTIALGVFSGLVGVIWFRRRK